MITPKAAKAQRLELLSRDLKRVCACIDAHLTRGKFHLTVGSDLSPGLWRDDVSGLCDAIENTYGASWRVEVVAHAHLVMVSFSDPGEVEA